MLVHMDDCKINNNGFVNKYHSPVLSTEKYATALDAKTRRQPHFEFLMSRR